MLIIFKIGFNIIIWLYELITSFVYNIIHGLGRKLDKVN